MKKWITSVSFFFSSVVFAAFGESSGAGKVANNLMEPVAFASDFIYTGCMIVGGSFLLASIIKYIDYRRNPQATPFSTVAFLFIGGLTLLGLPFIYLLAHHKTPYSMFR